jgi:hypothetical protein
VRTRRWAAAIGRAGSFDLLPSAARCSAAQLLIAAAVVDVPVGEVPKWRAEVRYQPRERPQHRRCNRRMDVKLEAIPRSRHELWIQRNGLFITLRLTSPRTNLGHAASRANCQPAQQDHRTAHRGEPGEPLIRPGSGPDPRRESVAVRQQTRGQYRAPHRSRAVDRPVGRSLTGAQTSPRDTGRLFLCACIHSESASVPGHKQDEQDRNG